MEISPSFYPLQFIETSNVTPVAVKLRNVLGVRDPASKHQYLYYC